MKASTAFRSRAQKNIALLVSSGPLSQTIEAGKSRQHVIATLGCLESVTVGESSPLINGLLHVSDQPTLDEGTGETDFAPSAAPGC